jgi:hypothetical protein
MAALERGFSVHRLYMSVRAAAANMNYREKSAISDGTGARTLPL